MHSVNVNYQRVTVAGICLVLVVVFTLLWYRSSSSGYLYSGSKQSFVIPQRLSSICILNKKDGSLEIGTLHKIVKLWNPRLSECRHTFQIFERIFEIKSRYGEIAVDTQQYKDKIRGWLGNDDQLYKEVFNQSVTSIFNKYIREEALFNPLRSKRPISKPDISDLDYIKSLNLKTEKSCDFCRYKNLTAHDITGRLQSDLAFSAANTFRYDRKHQMFLPRLHHPLNWTKDHLLAMFQLAIKWLAKEHESEPTYSYPVLMWDLLPHAGASQVHPHLQVVLEPGRHTGPAQSWVMAADDYNKDHQGQNYFSDYISVHEALGLTVRYKTAVAIATLTPKKDNEVVIISKAGSTDHFELLYCVMRAYIEDKKVYPFSMGMALPSLNDKSASVLPAFTRIVTRGTVSEVRSDISSLELFSFYNVNSDPFKLILDIQRSVDKRCTAS